MNKGIALQSDKYTCYSFIKRVFRIIPVFRNLKFSSSESRKLMIESLILAYCDEICYVSVLLLSKDKPVFEVFLISVSICTMLNKQLYCFSSF